MKRGSTDWYDPILEHVKDFYAELALLKEANYDLTHRANAQHYYTYLDATEKVRDHWKEIKSVMMGLNRAEQLGPVPKKDKGKRKTK